MTSTFDGRLSPSAPTAAPPAAVVPAPHPAAPPPGTRMGPHYEECFACGTVRPGGLRMVLTVGAGLRVTAEFTVTDEHQGAPGLAHGGVLAAAFDETLGSLLWLLHTPAVTGRLETDYLRPVPVGSTLFLAAECTGVLGRKIYSRGIGRLDGPDGVLAVRAAALFVAVPLEHFTTHGRREPDLEARFRESYNP